MEDLISIIIPNYNKSKWIDNCLNSVINQTYKNIEIVFIDDCSTDNSVEVVKSINDDRIILIQNESNKGVSYCRNIGIKSSNGSYISTIDSDDIFFDNRKLELEMNLVNRNNISFSNIAMIGEKNEVKVIVGNPNNIKEGNLFNGILNRNIFIPRDFLCHKSAYYKCGFYDESMSLYEDWDLKIRLSMDYNWVYSGIVGIGYRRLPGGLSSIPINEHNRALTKIKNRYVGKIN